MALTAFLFLLVAVTLAANIEELTKISALTVEVPFLNLAAVAEQFLQPHFHVTADRRVTFDCDGLFQKLLDEREGTGGAWPPPTAIPAEMLKAFTLDGLVTPAKWYLAEKAISTQSVKEWPREEFEKYLGKASTCGGYNSSVCETALSSYANDIGGKRALVLGSQSPWAEAALLNHGAVDVLTVEYVQVTSLHDQVLAIQPHELAARYMTRTLAPIDVAFSFSSIEHDGLGRYGDPINPFGDLETMARLHCLLPPGGLLLLGVPTGSVDFVVWNAHRIYGRHRLRLLLQDWWEVVDYLHELDVEIENEAKPDHGNRYEEALWVLRKRDVNR
eukprot:gene6410-4609_t